MSNTVFEHLYTVNIGFKSCELPGQVKLYVFGYQVINKILGKITGTAPLPLITDRNIPKCHVPCTCTTPVAVFGHRANICFIGETNLQINIHTVN